MYIIRFYLSFLTVHLKLDMCTVFILRKANFIRYLWNILQAGYLKVALCTTFLNIFVVITRILWQFSRIIFQAKRGIRIRYLRIGNNASKIMILKN